MAVRVFPVSSLLGHLGCACKKSESSALVNSEPPLSLSEPINTCCHTVITPPKLFSTQGKWKVVKTLLRKSLVRLVANVRAGYLSDGWALGPRSLAPSLPLRSLFLFFGNISDYLLNISASERSKVLSSTNMEAHESRHFCLLCSLLRSLDLDCDWYAWYIVDAQ